MLYLYILFACRCLSEGRGLVIAANKSDNLKISDEAYVEVCAQFLLFSMPFIVFTLNNMHVYELCAILLLVLSYIGCTRTL